MERDTHGTYGGHGQPGHYGGGYGGRQGGGRYRGDRPGDEGEHRQRRGIPLSDLDPELTAISHRVIGCARDVHVALGPGYDEPIYLDAMKAELDAAGIRYKAEAPIEIRHRDTVVGRVTADLMIEDRFIVDVMARPREVGGYDRAVLRAQLKAADLELGLIINFAGRLLKDGLVRVLNIDKLRAEMDEEDDGDEDGEPEEA